MREDQETGSLTAPNKNHTARAGNKRDTKGALARAATQLMEKRGYGDTSIEDIVRAADLTKPTFYYYYNSKLVLLTELLEESMGKIEAALEQSDDPSLPPPDRLSSLAQAYVYQVLDRPDLWTIYERDRGHLDAGRLKKIKDRERKVVARFEEVIKEGTRDGVFRPVNPLFAAMGILGMMTSLHSWYEDRGDVNRKVLAEEYRRMVVSALLPQE